MIKKLCARIIARVGNRTVIRVFEFLRKIQRLKKKKNLKFRNNNSEINATAWKKHIGLPDKAVSARAVLPTENHRYIENQNDYRDMRYGKATMKYSGCEIFAVYNLLLSFKTENIVPLPELISEFEADGMVRSGMFGTAPLALKDYLERRGFETAVTMSEAEFDEYGQDFDSLILTMFNNGEDVFEQVHTISITKEKDGFVAHNVYCNGKVLRPQDTVTKVIAHINGGKARGIALIGVKK